MKTKINTGSQPMKLSLQKLVSKLLVQFQPVAVRKQSFIVNDIPGDFWVNTDEKLLTSIISSLFNAVVSKSINACIRISAMSYNHLVMVDVRDSNYGPSGRISRELEDAQPMAEELGGCITLNEQQRNITTVGLSFMNPPMAA